MGDALYKKSAKLGLSGVARMIGRLCATNCGVVQCVLNAVPAPRVIPVRDVFRYGGLAWTIDGPGTGLEAAAFRAREPTF